MLLLRPAKPPHPLTSADHLDLASKDVLLDALRVFRHGDLVSTTATSQHLATAVLE